MSPMVTWKTKTPAQTKQTRMAGKNGDAPEEEAGKRCQRLQGRAWSNPLTASSCRRDTEQALMVKPRELVTSRENRRELTPAGLCGAALTSLPCRLPFDMDVIPSPRLRLFTCGAWIITPPSQTCEG